MATKFSFGGKTIALPGAYSNIVSGFKNPPSAVEFGNIIIIDTGKNAGYGGGAGIVGTLSSGRDSVYTLTDSTEYQEYMKAGLFWKLAEALYSPAGVGSRGVSNVFVVKAATTVAPEIDYTFTGGGAAGGVLAIQVRDEGLVGNGVEGVTSLLTSGYAAKMVAGSIDTAKFKIQFYRGTFKGTDAINGIPYDGIPMADTEPLLLVESVEFANLQDFIDWAAVSATFNYYFKLKTGTVTGTGVVDAADLAANLSNSLAAGGTETYDTTALDAALDALQDVSASLVLADNWGDDAQSANNVKILSFIINEAKFKLQMVVGGGETSSKFTQANGSIPIAQFYDSDRVVVVHGGIKKRSSLVGSGFIIYDALYKAALVIGRLANLSPQVPITFKQLNFEGEQHSLTLKEQVQALDAGVLHTIIKNSTFVVNQGINSLQNNNNLINEDGTTHSIQVRRIADEIDKVLITNAEKELLGQADGVNRFTLSEKNVEDWTIGQLNALTVKDNADNYILEFKNVLATTNQDAIFTTYEFVPNNEITKLFFTGIMKLNF